MEMSWHSYLSEKIHDEEKEFDKFPITFNFFYAILQYQVQPVQCITAADVLEGCINCKTYKMDKV